MRKTLSLGKVDYLHHGRRDCEVTVEWELKDGVFAMSGNIWNGIKTDCYECGQNLETIAKFHLTNGTLFNRMLKVWRRWHLNDMHAGTPEQARAIEEWKAAGNRYDYTAACDHLKSIGLYEVEWQGKPYKYGHGWIKEELPADIVAEIESWG